MGQNECTDHESVIWYLFFYRLNERFLSDWHFITETNRGIPDKMTEITDLVQYPLQFTPSFRIRKYSIASYKAII
jgi:hypothetical protein